MLAGGMCLLVGPFLKGTTFLQQKQAAKARGLLPWNKMHFPRGFQAKGLALKQESWLRVLDLERAKIFYVI